MVALSTSCSANFWQLCHFRATFISFGNFRYLNELYSINLFFLLTRSLKEFRLYKSAFFLINNKIQHLDSFSEPHACWPSFIYNFAEMQIHLQLTKMESQHLSCFAEIFTLELKVLWMETKSGSFFFPIQAHLLRTDSVRKFRISDYQRSM